MKKSITKKAVQKAVKKEAVQKDTLKNSSDGSLGNAFTNSWKLMWAHKNLFLPDIFSAVVSWFFIILFFSMNGMFEALRVIARNKTESSTFIAESFKSAIASRGIGTLLLSGFIFLVLIIFTSVLFSCIKYLMIKQILEKKIVSFKEASKSWKEYFWGFIWVNLLSVLIILGVIFGAGIVAVIIGILGSQINKWLGIGLAVICMLVVLAVGVYCLLGLFYIKVIYFMEKPKAMETIKKSFKFFKENKKHVVLAMLIILGIGIGFSIIETIFGAIGALVTIVQTVWTSLFLFLSWKK